MAGTELARRNLVVATGTALSRITGLARVVMIGVVLGGGQLADAYVSANNAPNAVYELLVGGVLSAGLVPLFTDLRVQRDEQGTNAILTVGTVAGAVITVIAVSAAPLIFRVLTLNAATTIDVDVFRDAGTLLARILLVQVFFYGLIALATSLLYAHRRFFVAAWSPVLANAVTIAGFVALLVGAPDGGWTIEQVISDRTLRWVLGLGATLGIIVSAVAVVAAAGRLGHSVRWRFAPGDPAVRRLIRLASWTFGYVAVNQIALVIVQNLTEPGSGGRFAYSQAYTFFVLPHGLLAVSIATTLGPDLAEAVSRRARREFARIISSGARFTVLLTAPSAIGIFVLRRSIIGLFLQHGAFDESDAELVAQTLGAFALGLPAFSLYLFVLRGFYAHLDTRTPFLINAVECALNVVLGVVLVGRYGVPGLAASFSLAYAGGAVLAGAVLVRRNASIPTRSIIRSMATSLGASIAMGGAVSLVVANVGADIGISAATQVVVGVVVGVAVYVGVLMLLGADEVRQMWSVIARRDMGDTSRSN